MTSVADDLWEQAMTLTPEERRQLAYDLLETLEEKEPGYDEAWKAEFGRRWQEHLEHPENALDADEALDLILGQEQ